MSPLNHPPHTPSDLDYHLEWYACEHPERPHDPDFTAYWSECRACQLAFTAALINIDLNAACDYRTPSDPSGRRFYTLRTAAEIGVAL